MVCNLPKGGRAAAVYGVVGMVKRPHAVFGGGQNIALDDPEPESQQQIQAVGPHALAVGGRKQIAVTRLGRGYRDRIDAFQLIDEPGFIDGDFFAKEPALHGQL